MQRVLLGVMFLVTNLTEITCNTSPSSQGITCSKSGNCTEKGCDWNITEWDIDLNNASGIFAHTNQSAEMQSNLFCANGSEKHCLQFDYMMSGIPDKNGNNLSVQILHSDGNSQTLWTVFGGIQPIWYHAQIPFQTTHWFRIIIQGWKEFGRETDFIGIKSIVYITSSCTPVPEFTSDQTPSTSSSSGQTSPTSSSSGQTSPTSSSSDQTSPTSSSSDQTSPTSLSSDQTSPTSSSSGQTSPTSSTSLSSGKTFPTSSSSDQSPSSASSTQTSSHVSSNTSTNLSSSTDPSTDQQTHTTGFGGENVTDSKILWWPVIVGSVAVLVVALLACLCCCLRKRHTKTVALSTETDEMNDMLNVAMSWIDELPLPDDESMDVPMTTLNDENSNGLVPCASEFIIADAITNHTEGSNTTKEVNLSQEIPNGETSRRYSFQTSGDHTAVDIDDNFVVKDTSAQSSRIGMELDEECANINKPDRGYAYSQILTTGDNSMSIDSKAEDNTRAGDTNDRSRNESDVYSQVCKKRDNSVSMDSNLEDEKRAGDTNATNASDIYSQVCKKRDNSMAIDSKSDDVTNAADTNARSRKESDIYSQVCKNNSMAIDSRSDDVTNAADTNAESRNESDIYSQVCKNNSMAIDSRSDDVTSVADTNAESRNESDIYSKVCKKRDNSMAIDSRSDDVMNAGVSRNASDIYSGVHRDTHSVDPKLSSSLGAYSTVDLIPSSTKSVEIEGNENVRESFHENSEGVYNILDFKDDSSHVAVADINS